MPPHPPLTIPLPLFHLPRRRLLLSHPITYRALRPTSQIASTSSPNAPPPPDKSTPEPPDDFYALLLATPLPSHPAATTSPPPINPPPTSTTSPPAPTEKPTISFSPPLAGPSAHMRGLSRAAASEDRPPEPDNCCMSGCVNCVWESYREEVEAWAEERRRVAGVRRMTETRYVGRGEGEEGNLGEEGGGNGTGGEEEELFEGVDVGMREFMLTEKRVKARRERRERDAAAMVKDTG